MEYIKVLQDMLGIKYDDDGNRIELTEKEIEDERRKAIELQEQKRIKVEKQKEELRLKKVKAHRKQEAIQMKKSQQMINRRNLALAHQQGPIGPHNGPPMVMIRVLNLHIRFKRWVTQIDLSVLHQR